jgi:hypothetical protein
MSDPVPPSTIRRKFLLACSIAAATPLAARSAFAQQKQKVDPGSAQAKALNYVEDASKAKDPKHKPDQFCHNCQMFQAGPNEAWGPCAIFAGNLVANKGWCSAWVKKA